MHVHLHTTKILLSNIIVQWLLHTLPSLHLSQLLSRLSATYRSNGIHSDMIVMLRRVALSRGRGVPKAQ